MLRAALRQALLGTRFPLRGSTALPITTANVRLSSRRPGCPQAPLAGRTAGLPRATEGTGLGSARCGRHADPLRGTFPAGEVSCGGPVHLLHAHSHWCTRTFPDHVPSTALSGIAPGSQFSEICKCFFIFNLFSMRAVERPAWRLPFRSSSHPWACCSAQHS